MTRLEIATSIFQGMCAGDWQMPIPDGQTWDDVAIPRAFELADKMIGYRSTAQAAQFEFKEYPVTVGEQND